MTARVYRCTRCGAVATVYVGTIPSPSGCPRHSLNRHAWRLAF
jgi:hypothetical protein